MGLDDIGQMLIALSVTVLLANFLLRKLNNVSRGTSDVIKVIERVPVSKSSSLSIVQVDSEYLLMSISETKSEVIKTFTQQEKEAIQKRLIESRQAKEVANKLGPYSEQLKAIQEKFLHKARQFEEQRKERNT
ncbi:flagellar protein FliO/FliZ [Alkalibacterium subtropicum]|uniref:Flagellar protein FliO/FliZ n=1 Tax=Alkalibacterium subtropicum TaxID=753702 RepID=A0A1I1IWC9_9LACT|nr:flagellar biosynthetic protein FliO [Alkalibacterium subtropicum]SFC40597.1 flagellar protein FliO/FliZ [Alkalibacterium subtropicum]